MSAVIRESVVEDIQDSKHPPVNARDLKTHKLVDDESACYRVTLQVGPNSHWQKLHGLGKNGWKIEPDENNKEAVKATPKYVLKDVTIDGATLNGRIVTSNEFIAGLLRNDRIGENIPVVRLDQMLAVISFELIPGKIADVTALTPWARDREFLNAYIDQRIQLALAERDKAAAAKLADTKK